MRNSRNRNGRGSRSSRRSSDQFNDDYNGSYGSDYDQDRTSYNQDQSFSGGRDNRAEYVNNSYTDIVGYQQRGSRGTPGRYYEGDYEHDEFDETGRSRNQGRWPESGEDRSPSRDQGFGTPSRDYGDEPRRLPYGNMGSDYGSQRYSVDEGLYGSDQRNKMSERGVSSFNPNSDRQWGGGQHAVRSESMRGKGPKGYRRSDERIQEDINDRLTDDHALDASGIEVTVKSSEVTLSGTVARRQDKRRAEDLAEGISGVSNVENRIKVLSVSPGSSLSSEKAEGKEGHESERSRTAPSKNRNHQNAEV